MSRKLTDIEIENLPKIKFEKDNIRVVGRYSSLRKKHNILIDWDLTRRCNFDCSYCPTWQHNNHELLPTIEELIHVYDMIDDYLNNSKIYNKRNIAFIGGEPTLIKKLELLIDRIGDNNTNIKIVTNGSLNSKKLLNLNKKAKIDYSVHLEYFDEKYKLSLIDFLIKRDNSLKKTTFKLLLPNQLDKILELIDIIKKYNNTNSIQYSVVPLYDKDNRTIYSYSKDELLFLSNNGI